jgi:hypothetical protein
MGVVAGARGRRHAVHGVSQVGRQRRAEVHVVAHHANEGGHVVIERREHRLIAVGPRHGHVLERDVIEGWRLGGDVGRGDGVVGRHQGFHGVERGLGGRRTRDSVVDTFGPVAIVRRRGHSHTCHQARQTELFHVRDLLGIHLLHPNPI